MSDKELNALLASIKSRTKDLEQRCEASDRQIDEAIELERLLKL